MDRHFFHATASHPHRHMRILLFPLALIPSLLQAQVTPALEELASHMVGSYTSAQQAKADTSYLEIELEMVRIWPERLDGVWLYVEQAVASSKAEPYRQRVYHLEQIDDSTFTSSILSIKAGEEWFGAYADKAKLAAFPATSLQPMEGCVITLRQRGEKYVGSTKDRECPNKRGKATYATSVVELFSDRMISWDRGYNDAGEQVWGAEKGGYIFIKQGTR